MIFSPPLLYPNATCEIWIGIFPTTLTPINVDLHPGYRGWVGWKFTFAEVRGGREL